MLAPASRAVDRRALYCYANSWRRFDLCLPAFLRKAFPRQKNRLSWSHSPPISTGDCFMKEEYKQFAAEFAAAVCARDYEAAHARLAPWLRQAISPAKLQEMIEREIRETCDAAQLQEMAY